LAFLHEVFVLSFIQSLTYPLNYRNRPVSLSGGHHHALSSFGSLSLSLITQVKRHLVGGTNKRVTTVGNKKKTEVTHQKIKQTKKKEGRMEGKEIQGNGKC